MHNTNTKKPYSYNDEDDLDFKGLINIVLDQKKLIFLITSIFSILGVIYSLSLPNIYQTAAILNPVDIESKPSSINSNIANLAGVSLPVQGTRKTTVAVGKLKSYSFFEDNILPDIFLPDLMAIESWNSSANKIIYDADKYNESLQSWNKLPSNQESYRVFKKNLQIIEDQNTGFVTISFKHQSPFIAKLYIDLIVKEINNFFKRKDKTEAQASFDYLNERLAETSFTEIKLVIAQLLQQKTQTLTLIEASEFYVFEYIDSPIVMENKYEPSRAITCIAFALLGMISSLFFALIRYFYSSSKI